MQYADLVGLGESGLGLQISNQFIGVASEAVGFEGVDGVLGYVCNPSLEYRSDGECSMSAIA